MLKILVHTGLWRKSACVAKVYFLKITLRPALCTLLMGGAAWAIYGLYVKLGPGNLTGTRFGMLVGLLAAIFSGVLIYAVLVIALRAITREDMKLIPRGERIANFLRLK